MMIRCSFHSYKVWILLIGLQWEKWCSMVALIIKSGQGERGRNVQSWIYSNRLDVNEFRRNFVQINALRVPGLIFFFFDNMKWPVLGHINHLTILVEFSCNIPPVWWPMCLDKMKCFVSRKYLKFLTSYFLIDGQL